ncbi:MAG: peptidase M48 family protein [Verrucomicrobia bacterium]|nr:MAG: peptidase M48 family protein [Verrucomicrobiota bacterium]
MERRHIKWLPLLLAGVFLAYQYFSSEKFVNPETGRKSHVAMSTRDEALLGLQTYQQVLAQSDTISTGPEFETVKGVASRLASATGKAGADFDWQVSLIHSPEVNAFCLPGGKIVVYTGILPVTQNEAALATVLGYEMAHATSRHGSQRVLEQNFAQTALTGVAMSLSDMELGAGAQFGVLMPFSRKHESEADAIGLHYMARAGYDPRESIHFWQRMENTGRAQPPEFLSSHPSHGTRIQQLQAEMPKALEEYNKSSAAQPRSSL